MTKNIARVVQTAISESYRKLLAHEAGLFDGEDAEAIHQARVATRRLRSDLRTFEPFLDERWATSLRGELRWLTAELGGVRDVDVMRARLREHAERLPPADADAARLVLCRLDGDREAAHATLMYSLRSPRYIHIRSELGAAAVHPELSPRAHKAGPGALARVVRGRWRKLQKGVGRLGPRPSDEALHAVRILAKRTRYATEAVAPAFGKRARRFAKACEEVQNVLGEQHDAVVAERWLAKAAHESPPDSAYALGRLAQLEHDAALAAHDEFRRIWKRTRRKKLRDWL